MAIFKILVAVLENLSESSDRAAFIEGSRDRHWRTTAPGETSVSKWVESFDRIFAPSSGTAAAVRFESGGAGAIGQATDGFPARP
ncbi:MAG: hypothetical protein JNL66_25615 [Alphaproteobacteria bacterium]|nr:hypothetical protein [Alphaproteobacteria bacterium]